MMPLTLSLLLSLCFYTPAFADGFIQMRGKRVELKDSTKKTEPTKPASPASSESMTKSSGTMGSFIPKNNIPSAAPAQASENSPGMLQQLMQTSKEHLEKFQKNKLEQDKILQELDKDL